MSDCIFCKIAAGDIPSSKIYEDDDVIAFKDIHPQAPVHFLIVPKKHIVSLAETQPADEPLLGKMLGLVRKLAKELRISVLTVTRAYNELADEGLVENVQGKGTFVMERGNKLMKERARERIMDKLREVSIEAKAADISLLDLLGMFEKAYREQS